MAVEKMAETAKEVRDVEKAKAARQKLESLDKPLNAKEVSENTKSAVQDSNKIKNLDKPLNKNGRQEIGKIEKMEPPIRIQFKCPEGVSRKEFERQIKAQERGINSQTVAENMKNRNAFEQRKKEIGNGRDLETGRKAQEIARQKALQKRIESNQKKGMSYRESKAEAENWIKGQAALHNPDQIAGGDPAKVSRMGDAKVNSSIGAQWGAGRASELSNAVKNYARGKSQEELANTKMNVRLEVI